ncbi:hypothetical protein ACJMK2_025671 [Sinanodonta woodiana]|uniref:Ig-like domain-containing protein n=1 Tax=Sinanodonta woodiana TaxID=1069815 RepID=A0ABD3XH67_SINWO
MYSNIKLVRTNLNFTDRNMSFLHLVFCSLTMYSVSDGRIMNGIIGQNVSLSWTFKMIQYDAFYILHNESRIVKFFPNNNVLIKIQPRRRVFTTADYTMLENFTVTTHILDLTKNDAGTYRVVRQWNLEDFDDRIDLQIIDERFIPRIEMILYNSLESSIYLQCRSSSAFTHNVLWKLNGSLIKSRNRYSQNKNNISIKNITINDSYNVYTCGELGMQFESNPFRLSYGPKEIFVNADDNVHEVDGFETVVRFCYANCFPPCDIVWINTHGETMIQGAELKLVNLTIDVNYTCQATNPINSKDTIFKTIFIKVKSGANHKTTTSEVDDKERTDYPTTRELLYTALGMGLLLAVGISSYLMYKRRAWVLLAYGLSYTIVSFETPSRGTPLISHNVLCQYNWMGRLCTLTFAGKQSKKKENMTLNPGR